MSDARIRTLIVDDEPLALRRLRALLADEADIEIVGEAANGSEAVRAIAGERPDLVFLDVQMPELDGFELAGMIREHPRFRQTALIFVSAIYLAEFDRLRGYEAGAVDYVPVPVVLELLRAKVRVFADLYRKTRQLENLNVELERRVEERTAELAQANADLERRVGARGPADRSQVDPANDEPAEAQIRTGGNRTVRGWRQVGRARLEPRRRVGVERPLRVWHA